MPDDLSRFSDAQLETFLSRVLTRDLLPFLLHLSQENRQRILGLVSPISAAMIQRALADAPDIEPTAAQRILKAVASGGASCVFCRIFAGELPASYVYQDEQLAVIMDLYPVTPGHALVIPRSHVEFVTDLPMDTAASLMTTAQKLGAAVMHSALGPGGFNLHLANGGAAHQDVFHVHLHVVPRYHGDGFGFVFPPGYPEAKNYDHLDAQAEMIKRCLAHREITF